MEIVKDYKSKKYYVGSKHETLNHGEIEILGKVKDKFVVTFKDGTRKIVGAGQIRSKSVRNRNDISVYEVGFIGEGKYRSYGSELNKRRHNLWISMMWRCYSPNGKNQRPTYNDCLVDQRWHNFQNFCEDIKSLSNYEKWLNPKNKMQMDKDIKVKGNTIYSKDTCVFATPRENMRNLKTSKQYKATRVEDGYSELFHCITLFCEKHQLERVSVSLCVNGHQKKSKGWVFCEV